MKWAVLLLFFSVFCMDKTPKKSLMRTLSGLVSPRKINPNPTVSQHQEVQILCNQTHFDALIILGKK